MGHTVERRELFSHYFKQNTRQYPAPTIHSTRREYLSRAEVWLLTSWACYDGVIGIKCSLITRLEVCLAWTLGDFSCVRKNT